MVTDVDTALVAAARDGDRAALEAVVTAYLPLVYNIVGRALTRDLDVDDTVQDVMLHVVRALPGLRDPGAFRSWLVAITMNQIRQYHRPQQAEPKPLEVFDALPDPGADFAELTVWKLGLTGQRQETARAAAWLDEDHRDLLALWWLVEAGQLSRSELVDALGLDPHVVTVRIGRMKKQLDTARGIVRALAVHPRCPELAAMTADWSGAPGSLWRKRLARHVQSCAYCLDTARDLLPVEGLLAGLAMVPMPLALAGQVGARLFPPTTGLPSADGVPPATGAASTHGLPAVPGPRHSDRRTSRKRTEGRRDHWKTRATAAVLAIAAIGGGASMLKPEPAPPAPRSAPDPSPPTGLPDEPAAQPLLAASPSPTPSPPSPPEPPRTAAPTGDASATHPARKPTASASPVTRPTASASPVTRPTPHPTAPVAPVASPTDEATGATGAATPCPQ